LGPGTHRELTNAGHDLDRSARAAGARAAGTLVGVSFVVAYGALAMVQAALVLAPGRPRRLLSSRALGLAIPAGAMVAGVALARTQSGSSFLTTFAAVATPLLAAACGWARGWRLPILPVLAVPLLYWLAWAREGSLAGDAADVALIAGACLAVTALVAGLAPRQWLVAGLVLLVALDCFLVWGNRQVEPASQSLAAATPPAVTQGGRPLPSLQQIDFGSAEMGWLDFAAPALLGLIVARKGRAAVATGVAAGAWGLLLFATSPIAATPPVLAGLAAGRERRQRSPGRLPVSGRAQPVREACYEPAPAEST
jgi:hypothetical protein